MVGSGFHTWKDVAEVAIVPVALALAALIWPSAQNWLRRRSFTSLIIRELQELAPYPESAVQGSSWVRHQTKELVHKRIFDDVSHNRDFILSLPVDWIYPVSQLWIARQAEDAGQWLYYLEQLSTPQFDRTGQIHEVFKKWRILVLEYEHLATGMYNKL
jgi:hypothetical protein